MAKVMISLPDDLLARLDARARQRGKTRSGLLQELAMNELKNDATVRADRIRALLATPDAHGGDAVAHIREQRRAR